MSVVKTRAVNTGRRVSADVVEVRMVVRTGEKGRDCIRFETLKYN